MQNVKIIFNQSIMISAATLLGIGIQMLIQHIVSGEVTFTWKWYIPLSICLTGFLSSLPTCFLLDLDRLKKEVVWIRIGIHFILVGSIVGVCGYLFCWYDSVPDCMGILLMYIIIYVFVWGATAWLAKSDEKKINEAIKDMQDTE